MWATDTARGPHAARGPYVGHPWCTCMPVCGGAGQKRDEMKWQKWCVSDVCQFLPKKFDVPQTGRRCVLWSLINNKELDLVTISDWWLWYRLMLGHVVDVWLFFLQCLSILCLSVCLSIGLSVSIAVIDWCMVSQYYVQCLSDCLSVCLSVHHPPPLGLIWTVMLVWRKGDINRTVSVL